MKQILMSAAFLLSLTFLSLWLMPEMNLTHQPLSTSGGTLVDSGSSFMTNQAAFDEVDYFSSTSQWVKTQIDQLQTDINLCLAQPDDAYKASDQIDILGQPYRELEPRYVGQGKMHDLFYRYPCPPTISNDLLIYP